MLHACLNGARPAGDHPALPVTPAELAADAAAVAALGVRSLHVHPRDATGAETLSAGPVAAAVTALRAAVPGVAAGVTTGAWIEADPGRRVALLAGWAGLGAGRPDFASVNVHEDGWHPVCAALAEAGIGIELGVFHADAAARLRAAGLPPGVLRVLVEVQPEVSAPVAEARRLLALLEWTEVPILLHGEDTGAWPVLTEARARGLDTRIGLEDVRFLPDGTPAADNAALVRAALP